MTTETKKSAGNEKAPGSAEVRKPLAEASAGSRPSPAVTKKANQDRGYFARWWSEYQEKMRVRFGNSSLLRLQLRAQQ